MKKIFAFAVVALCCVAPLSAQLIVSNDTTICGGQSVQLSVSGGTSYSWTPSNTLSSSSSSTPLATPTQTTSYIVGSLLSNTNLVVNGNFSQGNTGFTSSYIYEVPTNVLGEGAYFVGGNANHWNSGMSSLCNDHTSGADTNMLIANSSLTAQTPVWCTTLSVAPNSTYSLSAYFTAFSQFNLASMRWMVNGTPIGSAAGPVPFTCLWINATATWNSGNNTTATFCIFNPNTIGNGNDFAVDDISITGSGTVYDTVIITVINPPVVNLGNDTSICGSTNILLDAQNPGSSYLWNDNTTQQTKLVSSAGTYSVTVTSANSCTASSDIVITSSSLNPAIITSDKTQICSSDTSQVCVTGNFASYLWNTGSITNCIYTSLAGNYYVTVTDNSGCTAESNHLGISVYPSPSVSISVNGDTLSSYNSVNYQWYFNGTLINNATSNIYVAEQSGNYSVLVTDSNGCKASSTSISVVTGISNLSTDNGLTVYPNPNLQGSWQLAVKENLVGGSLEVTDNTGRILFKSEIRNQKSEIKPAEEISSGIYWLRIISEQKNYSIKLTKL